MTTEAAVERVSYKVVVNYEEQYSIWPVERASPPGWRDAGKAGSREDCLAYIAGAWNDMRPLSLRQQMAETVAERRSGTPQRELLQMPAERHTLVERLCAQRHRVRLTPRPEGTGHSVKECLDRDYVHLTFVDTRGGTQLVMNLIRSESDLSNADLDTGTGWVHLVGILVLNYAHVRCVADVDVSTLSGEGRLEIVGV
jgi:uncharacterized protein YbdZ (MbtH family)